MQLGLMRLPAGVYGAAAAALKPNAPLPGVYELEEISGSARRDYLPALIAGLILLYAFTGKRGKR